MTEYSIWPATNGPNTDANDPNDISRGVIFRLSTTGWAKRLRFYRGTTDIGGWGVGGVNAPVGRIYTLVDGLPVAGTDVEFTLSGTGWQEAELDTPVELSAGVSYKAAVITKDYTATGGYFSTGAGVGGIVNGIITAPDAGGAPSGLGPIQQGSFKQPTTGLEFPNQYFNGGNYWVDVVVDDEEPNLDIRDVTGTVDIPASTLDGAASKIGLVSPSVDVSALVVAASDKVGVATADVSVSAVLSGAAQKLSTQAPALAVTPPVLTGVAQATGAGVSMPVSTVLCAPWASFVDVPQRMRDKVGDDFTSDDWTRVLLQASELLWALSGRQWYGEQCTETAVLRSWPPEQGSGSWPYHRSWGRCGCWVHAEWINGQPYNVPTNRSHRQAPYAIALPREGVNAVTLVEVGGEPFTSYRFLRNGWLERTDGLAWSVCAGDTEITYQWGEAPPFIGKQAAITLAFHLALAEIGSDDCRLPSNVITVTRQGLTIQKVDPNDFLDDGRVGIADVDLFLRAYNPYARPSSGGVWSPDIPSSMRTPQ